MSDENNLTTTPTDPTPEKVAQQNPERSKMMGQVISRTVDKHGTGYDKNTTLRAEIVIVEGRKSITRHLRVTENDSRMATTKGDAEAYLLDGDFALLLSTPKFIYGYKKATKKQRDAVVRKRAKRPQNENEDGSRENKKTNKRDKKNGGKNQGGGKKGKAGKKGGK